MFVLGSVKSPSQKRPKKNVCRSARYRFLRSWYSWMVCLKNPVVADFLTCWYTYLYNLPWDFEDSGVPNTSPGLVGKYDSSLIDPLIAPPGYHVVASVEMDGWIFLIFVWKSFMYTLSGVHPIVPWISHTLNTSKIYVFGGVNNYTRVKIGGCEVTLFKSSERKKLWATNTLASLAFVPG